MCLKKQLLDDPETSAQGLEEVLGSWCTHLEIKLGTVKLTA